MRTPTGSWAVALALASFVVAGAPAIAQQQFEYTYGNTLDDGARGGVIATADGGFITVGETRSFPAVMNPAYNVYVVKTDRCGKLEWGRAYDIGGNDFGRRIRSVPSGGYIIVGTTQNTGSCTGDDIFLLRIDAGGNPQWTRTYGGIGVDEGWDVRVILDFGIAPGFVVAGGTRSFNVGSATKEMDAFLFRTDDGGTPVWGRVYGTRFAELFRSCIVTADFDIVAAGAMQISGPPTLDTNVFAVRVDGNGQLQWARHYGLATGREDAWALVELTAVDSNRLVLVGHTTSAGNASDGLAMVLRANGDFLQARAFGGPGWDEFRDIQLDPTIGSLMILTGFFDNGPAGKDVYVGEILPALQFGPAMLYGGDLDDLGWSIVPVTEGDHTESVVAGVTSSFGFGLEDLYLIKADHRVPGNCTGHEPDVIRTGLSFKQTTVPVCESNILVGCKSPTVAYRADSARSVCPCGENDAAKQRMPGDLSLRGGEPCPAAAAAGRAAGPATAARRVAHR